MVADRLLGIIVMAASAGLFAATLEFPFEASVYPSAVLVVIFLLSLSLAVRPQSQKIITLRGFAREYLGNRQMPLAVAAIFAFILLIEPLGFYISLFLFSLACQAILGARKAGAMLAVSVFMTLLIYGIFSAGLKLSIPMGLLENWL